MSQDQTQAAAVQVQANHNPLVDVKENTFTFRKTKDEETGVETKRPNIVAKLPVPSVEGLVKIMEGGGKGLELLLSAAEGIIVDYAKQLINDDPSITTENFPADAISWDIIANLPDTERRGRGIPKEMWEDFFKSYIETMPAVIGKSVDVVNKQAAIMAQKFQPLKNHEKKQDILPKFIEMLSLYASNSPDAEQFSGPIEFLLKKAEQFMTAENNTDLTANLGFE